jgi:hypothetical protein
MKSFLTDSRWRLMSKFWRKKVFRIIQDGGWKEKFRFSCHLGLFEKLFSTKLLAFQHQMNAKRRLKKIWILSEICQKI